MEKQSVEDSFRDAFHEAEMPPSSEVWTHIELGIEKEAGDKLKKSVVYYRWMTAASVLLAISLVGVGYFTFVKDSAINNTVAIKSAQTAPTTETLKKEPSQGEAITNEPTPSGLGISQDDSIIERNSALRNESIDSGSPISKTDYKLKSTSPTPQGANPLSKESVTIDLLSTSTVADRMYAQRLKKSASTKSPLPPLVVQRPYRIYFPKTEPDQIDLLLAAIEMEEKESKKKRNGKKEMLWTSVVMAAGSFNPVIASSSHNSPALAFDANDAIGNSQVVNISNQVEASGYSFSSGLSVGGKIAERWILQGGVHYLTQNSNYSSNAILVDGANNFKLASLNTLNSEAYNGAIQSIDPYQVSSTLKYFNVPVQAGYLIINKAFGWQLQGGISTDFFLQNTLSAQDAGLDKVSQSGGDESPYRTVNFSGLLGTEVSYRFGERYRVALNPGLRYPLQSVYKSELGVTAAPITFDVGLKFHYIFR